MSLQVRLKKFYKRFQNKTRLSFLTSITSCDMKQIIFTLFIMFYLFSKLNMVFANTFPVSVVKKS